MKLAFNYIAHFTPHHLKALSHHYALQRPLTQDEVRAHHLKYGTSKDAEIIAEYEKTLKTW